LLSLSLSGKSSNPFISFSMLTPLKIPLVTTSLCAVCFPMYHTPNQQTFKTPAQLPVETHAQGHPKEFDSDSL
jgi:hypothetical protein